MPPPGIEIAFADGPAVGLRGEVRALLKLSGPILITQLGTMLLGLVDTAVVGRLGEVPLGAVGLGNSVFFTVSVLGFGWMLALDPLIAQAVGAGESTRARELVWQGAWIGMAGAIPLALLIVVLAENIALFGVADVTAQETVPYLYARLAGLAPFFVLAACRAFLQAHELTRPLVIGVIVANVVNLPLSYLLVFGDAGLAPLGLPPLGVPAYGAEGAGWASAVATVLQLLVALAALRTVWGTDVRAFHRPERATILRVLRLGTPIGLALGAEVGSFAVVTVLCANLGTRALGGHNVALTLISTTFQIAIAFGAAGAVRVGHAIGRGDAGATRRAGLTAIGAGAAAMIGSALAFLLFPRLLARILTDDEGVIDAAVPLLAIAAAFQLFDGVQAVAAGTLRGAGDTRWPLVANLLGHYAIAVPLGAVLAFGLGWGAVGLWWGLSAGLTVVAIALSARFFTISKRLIARA